MHLLNHHNDTSVVSTTHFIQAKAQVGMLIRDEEENAIQDSSQLCYQIQKLVYLALHHTLDILTLSRPMSTNCIC